jgi:regulator of CtrA degradation
MSLSQANKEKSKVKLAQIGPGEMRGFDLLPPTLRLLIERTGALQVRVRRFDATIQNTVESSRAATVSPVSQQLGLLKAAFEKDAG